MENQIYNHPLPSSPPFSASLAMAFFANHFLKVKTDYTRSSFIYYVYKGGTNVPCQTSVQVDTPDLADNSLTAAFWYLCETNCIRFTNTANYGSNNIGAQYFIEFNRANRAAIPGLEFDLMEIIKHSAPNMTIEAVVKIFLQKKHYNPEFKILERLSQWFIQLGYGQSAPPQGFGFRNPSNYDFEFIPDCRRIAACQGMAQIIQGNWTKFQTQQTQMFDFLLDRVKSAIKQQTSRRSSNSSFNR